MTGLLTMLLSLQAGGLNPSAQDWFQQGVKNRNDARLARDAFLQAAQGFGLATPQSAHASARAWYLAGDTPHAIAAIHAGLAIAPHDRELQRDLEIIRETIPYPQASNPQLELRWPPPSSLRHRITPMELFSLATIFGLLTAIGLARRLTTRPADSFVLIIIGLFGLLAILVLKIVMSQSPTERMLVLEKPALLRKGNGASYPTKMASPLPAGTELIERGRRGGWVMVEVAGGARGWLPESAVLR